MSDLISRQAAIDIFDDYNVSVENGELEAYSRDRKRLCNLPSAQPMRKKGKWIERECSTEDKAEGWLTVIVCSCCDFPATTFYSEDCESRIQIRTPFCPNCGEDMRGDPDD